MNDRTVQFQYLKGISLVDAIEIHDGLRPIKVNDVLVPLTDDLNPNRLNIVVKDGIITEVLSFG